jgi:DNA-binding MarR family transcriptional regulator
MQKSRTVKRNDVSEGLMDGLTKLCRQLKTIKLPEGMTRERLSALAAIHENSPISVTALAEIEKVRPPTMSRMVSSLVDEGLAKRQDHKTDGRGVLISMTPKGKRAYQRATALSIEHLASALGKMPQNQIASLGGLAAALEMLDSEGT